MKKVHLLATVAALAAMLAAAAPLLARQNTAAGLGGADMFDIICTSLPTSVTSRLGIEATAAHEQPAGLYMPMFSTPPKGGAVYNGPPLDDC